MAILWFLGGVLLTVLLIFGAIAIFSAGIAAGKKQEKSQKSSDDEGVK